MTTLHIPQCTLEISQFLWGCIFIWSRTSPWANCVHSIQKVHVSWSFLYMVAHLFTWPQFASSSLQTAHLLILTCFEHLPVAKMGPWTETYCCDISTVFLLGRPLLLWYSSWCCAKTKQFLPKKLQICFFMGYIQKRDQFWQALYRCAKFVFTFYYVQPIELFFTFYYF